MIIENIFSIIIKEAKATRFARLFREKIKMTDEGEPSYEAITGFF